MTATLKEEFAAGPLPGEPPSASSRVLRDVNLKWHGVTPPDLDLNVGLDRAYSSAIDTVLALAVERHERDVVRRGMGEG